MPKFNNLDNVPEWAMVEPDEALSDKEQLKETLRQEVYYGSVLTDKEKQAIILHVYEGHTFKTCSFRMHCKIASVSKYVSRGISKLRRYFNS